MRGRSSGGRPCLRLFSGVKESYTSRESFPFCSFLSSMRLHLVNLTSPDMSARCDTRPSLRRIADPACDILMAGPQRVGKAFAAACSAWIGSGASIAIPTGELESTRLDSSSSQWQDAAAVGS